MAAGDVLDRLKQYWSKQDLSPAAKLATVADILSWEAKTGMMLPADLREYVLRVNGSNNGEHLEFGNDLFAFLPLSAMELASNWTPNRVPLA